MTAIAVVRSEHFIVIAADGANVDAMRQKNSTGHKIRRIGRFFYAAHNLVRNTDLGYDLPKIIEDNSEHDSLESLALAIAVAAQGPLSRVLSTLKLSFPGRFKEMFSTGQGAAIILAGSPRGRNHLSVLYLRLIIENPDDDNIEVKAAWKLCPGPECLPRCTVHPFIGPPDVKEKFDAKRPGWWLGPEKEVAKNAKALIQELINLGTNDFGPPITVLILKQHSFYWLESDD